MATGGQWVDSAVTLHLRKAQVSLLRALLLLQGALQCTNKWSQDAAAKFHHFAMVSWTTGGVGWLGLCFGSTTQRRRWPLPIAHCSYDRPSFAETAVRQRLDLRRPRWMLWAVIKERSKNRNIVVLLQATDLAIDVESHHVAGILYGQEWAASEASCTDAFDISLM